MPITFFLRKKTTPCDSLVSKVFNKKKEGHELKHFLPTDDATACMDGKQCVSLGLEIAQLKDNVLKA